MTVTELIAKLQEFEPDTIVRIDDTNDEYHGAHDIDPDDVWLYSDSTETCVFLSV